MSIVIAMSGTATTPLMTAAQNNALIGFIAPKLSAIPIAVATAIVA